MDIGLFIKRKFEVASFLLTPIENKESPKTKTIS